MHQKEKKTVLYIITKSNWGGAQKYVYDLATALPKAHFSVAVAYGQPGCLAEELTKANIAAYPISSLRCDVSLRADIQSFVGLLRLLRSCRPDIVHLNSSKAAGLGALAARIAGVKKIIFTVHGWPFGEERSVGMRAAMWFFSWVTALLSHHVICVSDFDLRIARRMPFLGGRAIRIHNGVTESVFLPRQERVGLRVLTNAEINPNKNLFVAIDVVVAARTRDADISYDIMGDGELRPALEQYISQKHAAGFISLLGFVPEGSRYYKNYDIFFLPSRKEGLPYVLLEAGMAGLAVIASNVGGIPEIIEDGASGILKSPVDREGFAGTLAILAKNALLRGQLGNTLKEKVKREFSLEQMIDKTTTLYES